MKNVHLLWDTLSRGREDVARVLLDECAPVILPGTDRLVMHIADRDSDVRSPAPKLYPGPPICGVVHTWPGSASIDPAILSSRGFDVTGYEVEESIHTEYGGNAHSGPRTWPDGRRSPGITAITLMERPARLSREEWIRRWHGRMSPVSEEIQPRTRYVRNLVLRPLTPSALPFEGIVEESWPSKVHVRNPYLFYGARNVLQLGTNMARILLAVTSFLEIRKIRTTMMSEYFLRT